MGFSTHRAAQYENPDTQGRVVIQRCASAIAMASKPKLADPRRRKNADALLVGHHLRQIIIGGCNPRPLPMNGTPSQRLLLWN